MAWTTPRLCLHEWADITQFGDPYRMLVCRECGERRAEALPYAVGGFVSSSAAVSHVLGAAGWTTPTPERAAPPELELSFETEPLVGWRTWKLVPFERHGGIREMRLASLTGREVWEPKTRAEGRCLPGNSFHYGTVSAGQHEAPWPSCHCGIWATREREVCENEMRQASLSGARVVGEVSMWGRVLEFKRGWRARYAYPKRLILLSDDQKAARDLERLYGVPVTCETPQPIKPNEWTDISQYVASLTFPTIPPGWSFEPLAPIGKAEKSAEAGGTKLGYEYDPKTGNLRPSRPKPNAYKKKRR